MSVRKKYDQKLVEVGRCLLEKRRNICIGSRESFIDERSSTIFGDEQWISLRHLANLEEGKTLPGVEMIIKLSFAYEVDAVDLFTEIYNILRS